MKYEPIPGQAHNPSEEETMSVIRSVLTEAEGPAPSRKAIRAERKAHAHQEEAATGGVENASHAFVERAADPQTRRRATDLPELETASHNPASAPRKRRMPKAVAALGGLLSRPLSALRGFRPSTWHLALISLALLVALRPHWFVITGVLIIALVVGTFLIFGADRIWRLVLTWLNNVEAHNPARAARLRMRFDRFACRWDAILDVFPDGSVDGLYMPDLQAMQDADAAHLEVLSARLDRMAHDS